MVWDALLSATIGAARGQRQNEEAMRQRNMAGAVARWSPFTGDNSWKEMAAAQVNPVWQSALQGALDGIAARGAGGGISSLWKGALEKEVSPQVRRQTAAQLKTLDTLNNILGGAGNFGDANRFQVKKNSMGENDLGGGYAEGKGLLGEQP